MPRFPQALEASASFRQCHGPRFSAAGLTLQFHGNQEPGIHFKVPVPQEYRDAILRGINEGLRRRFPDFPASASIWITQIAVSEIDSSEDAFYRAGRSAIDFVYSVSKREPDELDRAVNLIGVRRLFDNGSCKFLLACLLREADWRPLHASWWRGKEVSVIGAALDGSFILRHCDGTIRLWNHQSQSDTVIAPSLKDFLAAITNEETNSR